MSCKRKVLLLAFAFVAGVGLLSVHAQSDSDGTSQSDSQGTGDYHPLEGGPTPQFVGDYPNTDRQVVTEGDGQAKVEDGSNQNSEEGSYSGMLQSALRKILSSTKQDSNEGAADDSKFIKIGDASVHKDLVTRIGDINGDGVEDLVTADPHDNDHKGSVMLYLMNSDRSVLNTIDLTPGQSGLKGEELKKGDMFGSSVSSIGDLDGDKVRELAIGATGADARGAVYLMMMNSDGTVRSHEKLSASLDEGLSRQLAKDEGFGASLQEVEDINGDGTAELAVGSKTGATTILFLDRQGKTKVGVKFHADSTGTDNANALLWDEKELTGNLKLAQPSWKASSRKLASVGSGQCFFNDTNCQCGLTSAVVGSQTCYDQVGTDDFGHALCKARDCKPSYTCTCDGTEFCERYKETRRIFTFHGAHQGGVVLCHPQDIEQTITKVIPGASIPKTEKPMPAVVVGGSNGYNDTHCLCSYKKDVVGKQTCLDYARSVPSSAVICTTRPCRIKDDDVICDMDGKMLCEHEEIMTKTYMNNGPVPGSPNEVYCHEQTNAWDKTVLVE